MKYIDEYRNKDLVLSLAAEIRRISRKEITLMEVCGGHTLTIHRFGLDSLLPPTIRLLSGPGCPVCVSGQHFIDTIIACSQVPKVIIATYGDLVRVPGSLSSLEKEKAAGRDIRIIYSVLEAVAIARENSGHEVIFPGIGFETTAPATAAAIMKAVEERVENFYVHSAHKIMPPVMKYLVEDGVRINGFIAPGHVSAVTGSAIYDDLAADYGLGVVVSGFEPSDIMQSVLMLVRQAESGIPAVEIQYQRVVTREGNRVAQQVMDKVFEPGDEEWRGLGVIPESGLKLRGAFRSRDAVSRFKVNIAVAPSPKGCICGEILRGLRTPPECSLFTTSCTPETPVGACMVSAEGSCSTYYRYRS